MSTYLNAFQQALVARVISSWPTHSWERQCLLALNGSTTFDWRSGLVNQHGKLMSTLNSATWGITVEKCYEYCNNIPVPFTFLSFANCLTNYFLPWLALTAQLPYETGNVWNDIMSFCLAVGSPALVTYSLSLTILNKFWAKQAFDELRTKGGQSRLSERFKEYRIRIDAAQFLLQEGQQVPLRASQGKGWFSSLIVVPQNTEWWEQMRDRLRDTRRGVTASLVAQMLFAAIAYLLTVITSFASSLGSPIIALQIASGSLWIWLITVGTQYRYNTVEAALNRSQTACRAVKRPVTDAEFVDGPTQQLGLVVQPCLSLLPPPQQAQSAQGDFEISEPERLSIPTWLGARVEGDEQYKGPIFNYARVFTWYQLANHIQTAFATSLDNIRRGDRCEGILNSNPAFWNARIRENNLSGDIVETAAYAGLHSNGQHQPIPAYPSFSSVPSHVYWRIMLASIFALFVQWGTTGASILIAYLTPTIGLGCRSASYLLYGTCGTIVWICLLASMLLSHAAMLRYQAIHLANPTTDFRTRTNKTTAKGGSSEHYTRDKPHTLLTASAILLRCLGKTIAIGNALWLLVSSLFEFTGGFDTCWCIGNAPGMGSGGWIALFQDPMDLRHIAVGPWAGGLSMAMGVCLLSYGVFFLNCWKAGAGSA